MNYPAITAELRALRIELRELRIRTRTADIDDCLDQLIHVLDQQAATQHWAGSLKRTAGMYRGFRALLQTNTIAPEQPTIY